MKKEKGFTLIELLAVIVILAIIMVIAVPQILNIIEKSKQTAALESAKLYIKSVNQQIAFNNIDSNKYPFVSESADNTYDVQEINKYVNVKGDKPSSGTIVIQDSKVTTAESLIVGDYEISYKNNDYEIKSNNQSTLVLYSNGKINEKYGIERVHSSFTVTFEDNYIHTYNCGIKVSKPVDLTNYSKVKFLINGISGSGYSNFFVSKTVDVDSSNHERIFKQSSYEEQKIIELDVSQLKGEYYIYQNCYISSGVDIYKIWLEE